MTAVIGCIYQQIYEAPSTKYTYGANLMFRKVNLVKYLFLLCGAPAFSCLKPFSCKCSLLPILSSFSNILLHLGEGFLYSQPLFGSVGFVNQNLSLLNTENDSDKGGSTVHLQSHSRRHRGTGILHRRTEHQT